MYMWLCTSVINESLRQMQWLPGLPSVLIDVLSFIYCAVYR